jgi:hypothetical protein
MESDDDVLLRGRNRDFTVGETVRLLDLIDEAARLHDWEVVKTIGRVLPVDPEIALYILRIHGRQKLLEMGFDLTEADIMHGEGWMERKELE